jgi:hypothetical protein
MGKSIEEPENLLTTTYTFRHLGVQPLSLYHAFGMDITCEVSPGHLGTFPSQAIYENIR